LTERPQDDEAASIASQPWQGDGVDPMRQLRHELRTPLNQIIGYAEMLREEAEDEDLAHFAADLRKIESAGWRLLRYIDAFSRTPSPPEQAPPAVTALAPEVRAPTPPHAMPGPRATGDAEVVVGPNTGEVACALRFETAPDAVVAVTPSSHLTAAMLARSGDSQAQVSRGVPRLLVVDDDPLNLDMLTRRLELRGYLVEAASGGEEALRAIAQGVFDLVLLDVLMPDIDGIEVLSLTRKQRSPSDLPVIMVTACDDSADVVRALRLGANDYVTKPLDFEVVLARVQTQLSLKRTRDQVLRLNERVAALQSHMAESSDPGDLREWSQQLADEMAAAFGASAVLVWIREEEGWRRVAGAGGQAPRSAEVEALARFGSLVEGAQHTFPVLASDGEVVGVIVVVFSPGDGGVGRHAGEWSAEERGLLTSIARQMGSAIELRRTRQALMAAAERRRHRDAAEEGVEWVAICSECSACYGHREKRCPIDGAGLEVCRNLPLVLAQRYRLTEVIGEGGMGVIFAATDERLDRQVAIKVIKAQHFDDGAMRQRFAREALILARVDHPNVIAVYDSGELVDGSLFIVMELLRGVALSVVMRQQGCGEPAQVACLVRQGAAALAAAHRAGLVHRDIKPDNIFLMPSDGDALVPFQVKLLDFGVAKELTGDVGLTMAGHLIGTPLYMAPEQLASRAVDPRTDLYSLAVVAYEALTGVRPVRATELFAIIMEVIEATPLPPSVHRPQLSVEVDHAFAMALAKAPTERPSNVLEWAERCAALLQAQAGAGCGWDLASAARANRGAEREAVLPTRGDGLALSAERSPAAPGSTKS